MSYGRFKNPVEATLTGIKDIFRKQELADRLKPTDRLDGKTTLITGANSGLGFAVARQFAERGGRVIMACRSGIPDRGEDVKALTGSDQVEMIRVDLSDVKSIFTCCEELKTRGILLDIVVANAGVTTPKARKTRQGLEEMFMVNYLANFIFINRLIQDGTIPNQTITNNRINGKIPRILFISSDSHQGASAIDWEEFGVYKDFGVNKAISNYSYFKLLLNTYAVELGRRFTNENKTDIAVHAMCPGPVNTNIAREAPPWLLAFIKIIFKLFFQEPYKAALPVAYMCASEDFEGKTGEYLHMFNSKRMDEKVYDQKEGKKLWEASEQLLRKII